jgi:hypothetical protein
MPGQLNQLSADLLDIIQSKVFQGDVLARCTTILPTLAKNEPITIARGVRASYRGVDRARQARKV